MTRYVENYSQEMTTTLISSRTTHGRLQRNETSTVVQCIADEKRNLGAPRITFRDTVWTDIEAMDTAREGVCLKALT